MSTEEAADDAASWSSLPHPHQNIINPPHMPAHPYMPIFISPLVMHWIDGSGAGGGSAGCNSATQQFQPAKSIPASRVPPASFCRRGGVETTPNTRPSFLCLGKGGVASLKKNLLCGGKHQRRGGRLSNRKARVDCLPQDVQAVDPLQDPLQEQTCAGGTRGDVPKCSCNSKDGVEIAGEKNVAINCARLNLNHNVENNLLEMTVWVMDVPTKSSSHGLIACS